MSSDEVKGERKLYPLFKDCCEDYKDLDAQETEVAFF